MAVNFDSTPVSYNNPVIVVCNRPDSQQVKGYTTENASVAKWLSITQLILGLTCFVSQIITTALFEFVVTARTEYKPLEFTYYRFNDADHGGTGIWVGVVVIIAASIGIAGCKQNRIALIITHLVFNVFLLLAAISLITASGISVSNLKYCMSSGTYVGYSYSWGQKQPDLTFLGEKITSGGNFYCRHSLFKAWLAFSIILVIASSLTFIISLTLLVYNSMALRDRCCSCCYGHYAGAVIGYPVAPNAVYPVSMAYNANAVQVPLMYPQYPMNPMMSQGPTPQSAVPQYAVPQTAAPQVAMPPAYGAQVAGFSPPPKYEHMQS